MRWSTLPVSIVIHAAALTLFLFGPFASDLNLPTPWASGTPSYVVAIAAPAPIPVNSPPPTTPISKAAPTEPPDRISNEEPPAPSTSVYDGGIPNTGPVVAGVGSLNVGVGTVPPPPPAPPAVERPQVVRAGGVIREPKKIAGVPPVYPEVARQARIEGLVIIEAMIDEQGFVTDARVLKSQPFLDAAALAALKQWRYTPTLLNGVPVRVLMSITFNFKLGQAP